MRSTPGSKAVDFSDIAVRLARKQDEAYNAPVFVRWLREVRLVLTDKKGLSKRGVRPMGTTS